MFHELSDSQLEMVSGGLLNTYQKNISEVEQYASARSGSADGGNGNGNFVLAGLNLNGNGGTSIAAASNEANTGQANIKL